MSLPPVPPQQPFVSPPYRRPFRYSLWEFVKTVHQVVWVMGMFVGVPFVMIPVLGWIPQVRAFLGYCVIWALTISFVIYLVNDLLARGIPPW